jgi:tRNA 2-thiouridine synthesizing protein E
MPKHLHNIPRDKHNHIADLNTWQSAWIQALAAEIDLTITPTHEQAILWLRDYYVTYHHFPTVRFTVKSLRQHLGLPDFDSIQLHLLFPQSPLKLMSYCAGLPKPPHCM